MDTSVGVKATLLAIGSYEERLVQYLDYDPWNYKGVEEGQKVVATLVNCRTSDASRELAEALGFGVMDLGKHVMEGLTKGQHRGLMRFALKGEGARAADCWVQAIDALVRLGTWTFVFLPNA